MKKREDVVTVLLAFLVEKDMDEGVIDINSLYLMANKLVQFAAKNDFLDGYDYPDLSIPSLKKNKYVTRVALNGDLFFRIPYEKAVDIIKENMDLAVAIQYFSVIDYFDNKLKEISCGEFCYHPNDSNDVYTLLEPEYGPLLEESRLYTDGKVTEIEKDPDGNPRFKVEDSTYTIVTETVNKQTVYGCVTSNYFDARFLDTVYDDLMGIIKGFDSFKNQNNKVYLKRRN